MWTCFHCGQQNPDPDLNCGTCHMFKSRSELMTRQANEHDDAMNALNAVLVAHQLPRLDGTEGTRTERFLASLRFHK